MFYKIKQMIRIALFGIAALIFASNLVPSLAALYEKFPYPVYILGAVIFGWGVVMLIQFHPSLFGILYPAALLLSGFIMINGHFSFIELPWMSYNMWSIALAVVDTLFCFASIHNFFHPHRYR